MTTKRPVPGKGLSRNWLGFQRAISTSFVVFVGLINAALDCAFAAEQFLGAQSCASSMCHGGAAEKHDEFVTWSRKDFHTRAPATLAMARSTRIAETLKIADATTDARCTACHNPMATVPAEHKAKAVGTLEAVSCETCHNAAAPWVRAHTRTDIRYADKVSAGMRDLKDLYVRANACVACHQNLDASLRAAGHPELIFELDGQCADMPRHWAETNRTRRAQAWLVGQLVALREARAVAALTPENQSRAAAIGWLVSRATGEEAPSSANPDERAKKVAGAEWSRGDIVSMLERLASTGANSSASTSAEERVMRAERIVVALDRLSIAADLKQHADLQKLLEALFRDVQSRPDFDEQRFTEDLKKFDTELRRALATPRSGAK